MGSNNALQKRFVPIVILTLLLLASSCKKEEAGPAAGEKELHTLPLAVPANFPQPTADPDNPQTGEGVALGRMLFYDTRLSAGNRLSCASCHHQELAFSDGVALSSIGESGKALPRHAPALMNLAWMQNGLFWDGGSANLESQAFGPLASEDEMHQNLYELEVELKAVPDYVARFKKVFGREIRSADIVKALAQFERTLISGNSRYDRYSRKEINGMLSTEELKGLALVNANCRSCHAGELFTDDSYHNNGIDNDFSNTDHDGLFQGRSRLTFNPADLGKYKTPTLRNIVLTAPYMHDGRFASLEAVLDHYHNGVKVSPTTDQLLYRNGGRPGVPMSAQDRKAIITFLHTLTDESFTTNKQFSNPNKL